MTERTYAKDDRRRDSHCPVDLGRSGLVPDAAKFNALAATDGHGRDAGCPPCKGPKAAHSLSDSDWRGSGTGIETASLIGAKRSSHRGCAFRSDRPPAVQEIVSP